MEELKRIQVDENGGLIPTLEGGVKQNVFQDAVDSSQADISALPSIGGLGVLKGTAQVPQDFLNIIAHPVKSIKQMGQYYKEKPLRFLPMYATTEQAKNTLMEGVRNPEEVLARETGNLLGQGLTLAALGGLGAKGKIGVPKGYTSVPLRTTVPLSDFLGTPKPNIPSVKPKTLKVYHGSNVGGLTYLDKAYSGKNTPAVALNTASVSESPTYAKNYALQGGRDGYLYQGEIIPSNFIEDSIPINKQLKQQNLLNIADEYGLNPNTKGIDFFNYLQENYNPAKHGNIPIDKYLNQRGIDGVHFKNQMEYATTQNIPVQKILNVPYTEKNIYEIP